MQSSLPFVVKLGHNKKKIIKQNKNNFFLLTKNVFPCVCKYFHGPTLVAICAYLAIGLLCFEGLYFPSDERIGRDLNF